MTWRKTDTWIAWALVSCLACWIAKCLHWRDCLGNTRDFLKTENGRDFASLLRAVPNWRQPCCIVYLPRSSHTTYSSCRRIESLRVEYCNCVNAIEFQPLGQISDEDHQNFKMVQRWCSHNRKMQSQIWAPRRNEMLAQLVWLACWAGLGSSLQCAVRSQVDEVLQLRQLLRSGRVGDGDAAWL